jgi:hypothetical protein
LQELLQARILAKKSAPIINPEPSIEAKRLTADDAGVKGDTVTELMRLIHPGHLHW